VPQIIDFFNGMKEENTKMKLKYEIEWKSEDKPHITKAIDYSQYDVLVVIDTADFNVAQASKNISKLLSKLVGEKYDPQISFKEVSVYQNKNGKKAYRIRDL
jgi:light-regulated signal transduction histidine kinase (bacteriophytochrome)